MGTATDTTTFKVGDLVTPKGAYAQPGITGRGYKVVKINPRNLKCEALDGGRGLNFPPYALEPYDPTEPPQPLVTEVPFPLSTGQLVTLKRAYQSYTTETPMVVVKDDGRGKVNVVRLDNRTMEYLRIPRAGLVERDLEWLKGMLVN